MLRDIINTVPMMPVRYSRKPLLRIFEPMLILPLNRASGMPTATQTAAMPRQIITLCLLWLSFAITDFVGFAIMLPSP